MEKCTDGDPPRPQDGKVYAPLHTEILLTIKSGSQSGEQKALRTQDPLRLSGHRQSPGPKVSGFSKADLLTGQVHNCLCTGRVDRAGSPTSCRDSLLPTGKTAVVNDFHARRF